MQRIYADGIKNPMAGTTIPGKMSLPEKLKVGLAGYYGHDELCDDLIELAIKEAFGKVRDVDWIRLGYGGEQYGGDYSIFDLIILGGGSLLGIPFQGLVRGLKNTSRPFYIFGTGFREMHNLEDLKYLWGRANLISVRGRTSVERLKNYGFDTSKIEALGDPIFLLTPQAPGKGDYIGGVMRPAGVDLAWMRSIFEFLRNVRNQEVKLFNFCTDQGDLTGGNFGYKVDSLNIEDACLRISKSSFWFGNRLHPFCVALINSVPAIGVEIEFRKVEDVCSILDYPYWVQANTPLADFKETYFKLIHNWKDVDEKLQLRIKQIRKDSDRLVKRILEDAGERR